MDEVEGKAPRGTLRIGLNWLHFSTPPKLGASKEFQVRGAEGIQGHDDNLPEAKTALSLKDTPP